MLPTAVALSRAHAGLEGLGSSLMIFFLASHNLSSFVLAFGSFQVSFRNFFFVLFLFFSSYLMAFSFGRFVLAARLWSLSFHADKDFNLEV